MDASLFIDSVDHEWCWRARQRGYHCFIDESAEMRHALGSESLEILGYRIRDTAPSRLYYQFRNQLRLMIHYGPLAVPRHWRMKRLVILPLKFAFNALFQKGRIERITSMCAGIAAGIRNQGGPRPIDT
jgi:rhamnosyltransferase